MLEKNLKKYIDGVRKLNMYGMRFVKNPNYHIYKTPSSSDKKYEFAIIMNCGHSLNLKELSDLKELFGCDDMIISDSRADFEIILCYEKM